MPNRSSSDINKKNEILGVVLFALGLLTVVSLASYSPTDWPYPPEGNYANLAGKIGSLISHNFFVFLGYGAYTLVFLLFLWGWNRFRGNETRDAVKNSVAIAVLAFIYCSGTGLMSVDQWEFAQKLSGDFGVRIASAILIPYLGRIGAVVFLSALFAITVLTVTNVRFGPILSSLSEKSASFFDKLSSSWRERRNRKRLKEPKSPIPEPGAKSAIKPQQVQEKPSKKEPKPVTTFVKKESLTTPQMIPFHEPKVIDVVPKSTKPKTPELEQLEEEEESLEEIEESEEPDEEEIEIPYEHPTSVLLNETPRFESIQSKQELMDKAKVLEKSLADFDVEAKVVQVHPGPVITRFEVEPASGVKVNRIVNLADDLALVMRARRIRIQAPIPGRGAVGIEIPNPKPEIVFLREIIESEEFTQSKAGLPLAFGKTIAGEPYVADLTRMPHLLIAGATGSGKSVCINVIISSILFKTTPEEARLIMIDPKMLELSIYNDIPHLLAPVVTDPKRAAEALKWAVTQMEERYKSLAKMGVRNITDYNEKVVSMHEGATLAPTLPYIVIIIDELADLMVTASNEIEEALAKLAQMARAVGIHIIVATQRPSVDIITGVIKANFPSRIAFQVASKVDSRTIIDSNGAEKLLGNGDMLFLPVGQPEPIRLHGAYISGEETDRLVSWLKRQRSQAEEIEIFDVNGERADETGVGEGTGRDELFEQAMKLVIIHQQASVSFLQRRLKIGYSRAGRLIDELEAAGIVGPFEGSKTREVLVDRLPGGIGDDDE